VGDENWFPLRDGGVTSHVRTLKMRADYALCETKCLLKYVNCDALARLITTLLNKLMGTTGRRAEGQMFEARSGTHDNFSYTSFPICLPADCTERFHRVRSRIFRCGS
jgi:hypothetical protein